MYTTNDYEFEMDVLASYLISLFYKSKKNYSCTRQKIFKLLALNSLCNINHPELLNTLYVDDEIVSCPMVNSAITGGNASIEFSMEEERDRIYNTMIGNGN